MINVVKIQMVGGADWNTLICVSLKTLNLLDRAEEVVVSNFTSC